MNEHSDYPWDHNSDQPYIMRNKELKRSIYKRSWFQFLKANCLLFFLPVILLINFFRKKTTDSSSIGRCLGLSVHVETETKGKTIAPIDQVMQMVDELGVKHVIMRIPLADLDRLDTYINHLDRLLENNREVVINLLQYRTFLEDPPTQRKAIHQVLSALKDRVEYIQIGNAYNRRKWGFDNFSHYQAFFQEVRSVAKEVAPNVKLLGGSVIDFEIVHLLESLFHFRSSTYDGYAAQLYVDRRGAPENTQLGFNFLGKINFISLLHKLSWKSKGNLWITEFNWPLEKTSPFAPCKEGLVDELSQANFLARSYLIAIASGRVRTCYWHQLIAPGYGLVDNRKKNVICMPSYYAFATLIKLFSDATNPKYTQSNHRNLPELSSFQCQSIYKDRPVQITALWTNSITTINNPEESDLWLNQAGDETSKPSTISQSVVYKIKY